MRHQCIKGGLIQMRALRLVHHRLVRVKAAGRELLKDELVRTGHTARCVDIFNAHQPFAAMRACVQPTRKGCNQ